MKVCIVIPANNEAKAIGPLVSALISRHYDVVVVDDGSTDGTGQIAQANGAHCIRQETKHGKGYSLRAGFEYVLHRDYDGVIMMDGDGQHDINDLECFKREICEHKVSVIVGNRMANPKGMPFIRLCTNRLMSWLISSACGQVIKDTQCGYRYVSCEILRNLILNSQDFEIETEILMKASKKGFKIISVPVRTIYSDEESKISPFKDTLRFLVYFTKELFGPK